MDHATIDAENVAERYVTGRLSPEQAARFEIHYLDCPACIDRVEAAERLQRGLARVATEEAVRSTAAAGLLAAAAGFARSRQGAALLLVGLLILVPAVLGVRYVERLQGELSRARAELSRLADGPSSSRPRADMALVPLTSVRGSEDGPVHPVPLPREPAPVGLWVELGDVGVPAYRATLLGPDGGVVWSAENLEPNLLGALLMTFPPGFLSPGEYALRIEGLPATGEPLPAAYFRLRVSRSGS